MQRARPTEIQTLHFDLRHCPDGHEYQLHCGGKRIDLVAHDTQSRPMACTENAAFGMLAPKHQARLTHYISDVTLHADVPLHCYVTRKVQGLAINELQPICLSFVHIPSQALERCRRDVLAATGRPIDDCRLADHGITAPEEFEALLAVQGGLDRFKNPNEAAYGVMQQHPQLASQNSATAATIKCKHVINAKGVGGLVSAIAAQGRNGWAIATASVDKHGTPMTWGDSYGERAGKPVYHYKLTQATETALILPTSQACNTSQNDDALKGEKWSVRHGRPNAVVSATSTGVRALVGAGGARSFVLQNNTPGNGMEYDEQSIQYHNGAQPSDPASFSINVTNDYLRILWAWVQFYDDKGYVLDGKGEPANADHYEEIGIVNSVNTILAIPIKGPQTLTFAWPEKASSARLLNVGLGQNVDHPDMAGPAIALTVIFQYIIPGLLLAGGAALEKGQFYKRFIKGDQLRYLISLLESVFGSAISQGPSEGTGDGAATGFGDGMAGYLVGNTAQELLKGLVEWIAEKMVEAEIIDSVPVAGWIARVASMIVTAASILETSVEVAKSPSTYSLDLKRIVAVKVGVLPDPIKGTVSVPATWPATSIGGHWLCQVQYKDGTNFSSHGPMPDTTSQDAITCDFPQLPAGGSFQIIFGVYSADNWLAGKWTSGWINALPRADGDAINVNGAIIQSLAKLTEQTQYDYVQSLRFVDGAHVWKSGERPTAVTTKKGRNLVESAQITLNDKAYMLGYCWQGEGMDLPICGVDSDGAAAGDNTLYAFQNINVGAHPQSSLKMTSCGFTAKPAIVYDQFGPAPLLSVPLAEGAGLDAKTLSAAVQTAFAAVKKPLPKDAAVTVETLTAVWEISWPDLGNPAYVLRRSPVGIDVFAWPSEAFSQRNFYVDPRNDTYHLRHVTLDNATPFDMVPSLSWGRFNAPHLDAFAVHPAGYVIGVNYKDHRLEVLKLPEAGVPDKDAKHALVLAGMGQRQGLLLGPKALTITSDGRILVMETGNQRVQAFDINGNPVPSFDGAAVGAVPTAGLGAQLDARQVPQALREGFAAAGVSLSGRWMLANGDAQIQIDLVDDKLVITRAGSSLSTMWTIASGEDRYALALDAGQVMVALPGGGQFALPADAETTLDHGQIMPDIVQAFSANGITLTTGATVSGNQLTVPAAGAEGELALGQIPTSVVAALASRSIQLDAQTQVHDALLVAVKTLGKDWVITDPLAAQSYRLTLSADTTSIAIVHYLPFFDLHMPERRSYTSLSSELKGYIYVLSFVDDGSQVSDYALDIYEPSGAFLCTTPGINAAQLVVDQWRSVYTLDFDAFEGPDGRVEPSISLWTPSTNNQPDRGTA